MLTKNAKVGLGILFGIVGLVVVVGVVNFFRSNLVPASTSSYGESNDLSVGSAPAVKNFFQPQAAHYDKREASGIAATRSAALNSKEAKQDAAAPDRLIVKTGQLAMVVKDVRSTVQAVVQYATKSGGFVVNSDIHESGGAPYATVVVRVPAKVFDQGIGEVKALGEVQSESVSGQDVTEEYVDLESRLKNLRATEEQLLAIMKRSGSIPDVLAVQRELMYVREQIEQIQGRMKYLRESADLSTLTVHLSTDPSSLPVLDNDERWKPLATLKDAAGDLVEVGKVVGNLLIRLVVFIPLWLVIWLVIWLIVKFVRRAKAHKQTSL